MPNTRRMSCGFSGPSCKASPARTRSPSCTLMCVPRGMSYSRSSPSSPVIISLRLPFEIGPSLTVPSISDITAASPGRRASNNSTTRGRPPVMSLFFAVADHQVRAHRHLVSLQNLVAGVANFQPRLFLFVGRILDDHVRQTSHLVSLFVESDAFFQVLELKTSANFGKNCEGERVPGSQQLILRHQGSVLNQDVRAIDDLITG